MNLYDVYDKASQLAARLNEDGHASWGGRFTSDMVGGFTSGEILGDLGRSAHDLLDSHTPLSPEAQRMANELALSISRVLDEGQEPHQAAANMFRKGAISKGITGTTTFMDNGVIRMEYLDPANDPRYGKRYVQDVDLNGARVREYKETWGPDGLIETKWFLGGP